MSHFFTVQVFPWVRYKSEINEDDRLYLCFLCMSIQPAAAVIEHSEALTSQVLICWASVLVISKPK